MRKNITILVTATLLALAFAACGQKNPPVQELQPLAFNTQQFPVKLPPSPDSSTLPLPPQSNQPVKKLSHTDILKEQRLKQLNWFNELIKKNSSYPTPKTKADEYTVENGFLFHKDKRLLRETIDKILYPNSQEGFSAKERGLAFFHSFFMDGKVYMYFSETIPGCISQGEYGCRTLRPISFVINTNNDNIAARLTDFSLAVYKNPCADFGKISLNGRMLACAASEGEPKKREMLIFDFATQEQKTVFDLEGKTLGKDRCNGFPCGDEFYWRSNNELALIINQEGSLKMEIIRVENDKPRTPYMESTAAANTNDDAQNFSCENTELNAQISKQPFQKGHQLYDRAAGKVTISGLVESSVDTIFGELAQPIKFVRFDPPNDAAGALFHKEYSGGRWLRFNLGILQNNKLVSSAEMSENTRKKILNAVNTGKEIELTFYIPYEVDGMGVPAYWSSACKIE